MRLNLGKAAALNKGFEAARGKIVFTLDADLQDDPKEIPHFIAELQKGCDLVCGWKFERKDPRGKRFFSKMANGVTRLVTSTQIHDMNCLF